LMQAARGHLVETVRVLIRAGSDRGQADDNKLTASRYAFELGPPPKELSAILAPSDLGSLELSRRVSRFDKPDFKIALLGSWNESTHEGHHAPDELEFLEVTGERQILIQVQRLKAAFDHDAEKEAIGDKVKEHMARILREETPDCKFTEVRFFEADHTRQARWTGSSKSGSFFVAACIYAATDRFVTLSYRDFRPNLTDETRGRQAGESVASFRVKTSTR